MGDAAKIHALVDALGYPVELMLSPGQANDLTCALPLLEDVDPGALIGDKAYDADAFIETLAERNITPVIPSHLRRATPLPCDFALYSSAISSSASTNSSTFVPSRRATTNSPEIFSLASSSHPLSSSSTGPSATVSQSALGFGRVITRGGLGGRAGQIRPAQAASAAISGLVQTMFMTRVSRRGLRAPFRLRPSEGSGQEARCTHGFRGRPAAFIRLLAVDLRRIGLRLMHRSHCTIRTPCNG